MVLISFATTAIVYNIVQDNRQLKRRSENAARFASESLPTPIWNFREKAISDVVEALFLDDTTVYVSVIQHNNNDAETKKVRDPFADLTFENFQSGQDFVVTTTPINYELPDGQLETVGTLRIAFSKAAFRRGLYLQIGGIVLLTIAIIGSISLTTVFVSRRYIF